MASYCLVRGAGLVVGGTSRVVRKQSSESGKVGCRVSIRVKP